MASVQANSQKRMPDAAASDGVTARSGPRKRASRMLYGPCFRKKRRPLPTSSGCFWKKRSEEHTSELQSLMRISYAVFCLKKKKKAQYKSYSAHRPTEMIN